MTTDTTALPVPAADKLAKAERTPRSAATFPPLGEVTSPTVTTEAAAHYLNRRPQTLRIWSMGRTPCPVAPMRINGRLAWPTAALKKLLGIA
jgi:hypothetical protein